MNFHLTKLPSRSVIFYVLLVKVNVRLWAKLNFDSKEGGSLDYTIPIFVPILGLRRVVCSRIFKYSVCSEMT